MLLEDRVFDLTNSKSMGRKKVIEL